MPKVEIGTIDYQGKSYVVYRNSADGTVWVKDDLGNLANYQDARAENNEATLEVAVEMLKAAGK